ncbi:hypothetical protein [Haloparvum sedimenti]|uniref:hypothetical protein n=1 Tax=Haloparvum sedimenti TaxID=1678448 RepID=UPI00071E9C7E|nr:hypothetical protein [Haloparvum sedimenti]
MSFKGSGTTAVQPIDRYEGGVGWIAYPDEEMERASHAVAVHNEESDTGEPDVWVFDPVDGEGVDDLLAELGTVAGVVLGLDRHKRDAAAVARRHDVAVHIPEWMTGVQADLDAPVEQFGGRLADTGFRTLQVRNSSIPPWQEAAFFDGETLIVPEAVGTASFFRVEGERLGVHPMLRVVPPRTVLGGLDPDRILVGHGEGIHENAAEALREALSGSRRSAPRLYAKTVRSLLGV